MKRCQNCGTKNADSAKQCNFCDTAFPEISTAEKEKKHFNHNEAKEKKNAKKRIFAISAICALLLCGIACVLIFVFSTQQPSKAETLYDVISKAVREEMTYVGTLEGEEKVNFTIAVKENEILFSFDSGEYETALFSKDGLVLKKGEQIIPADKSTGIYRLYTDYLILTSTEKNLFSAGTADFKEAVLPQIQQHITPNFHTFFHEDAFSEALCAIFATLKDEEHLRTYTNISFPQDVNNGEITFDLKSYDLQNFVLSQLKQSFKSSAEYDEINQRLKDAKSNVKSDFKAKGTLKTKEGSVETFSAEIKYNGQKYKLSIETA
jgi:hypothetical protein